VVTVRGLQCVFSGQTRCAALSIDKGPHNCFEKPDKRKPGWEDYQYWQKPDRKILRRINTLIKKIKRNPFEEIGKPEPLKHALPGYCSRRIDA
jgi:Txe/YoeB family toxin of toxin-antitoxin system